MRALEHVQAALAIDPEFLAAQSLRDRILTAPPASVAASRGAVPAPADARPLVSADGYARFEERARRRRVDRRVDAARAAIAKRRLKEAASAIDEITELDPNLPELATLATQMDELRRTRVRSHGGPWLAAVATFAGVLLAATYLQESGILLSRPFITPAPLVQSEPSTTIDAIEALDTTGTTGTMEPAEPDAEPPVETAVRTPDRDVMTTPARAVPLAPARPTAPEPSPQPAATRADTVVPASAPAPPISPPQPIASPVAPPPLSAPAAPAVMALAAPAPSVPAAVPAERSVPPTRPVVDDDRLVRDTLQRYRTAYEDLDAHSAQAVWPAVNQAALARAFDGLESQTLIFDACSVQLRGEAASAICRGSARYVPKVGSREPRIEPRVWNFTLRKNDGGWKIESARAQR